MTNKEIKAAFERNEQALSRNPLLGKKTGKVKVAGGNGLACEIESGPWKLKTDMPKQVGGSETAPTPGILEAGALGSCIVTMVKMWAAKFDTHIDNIEVEVEFDADVRYLFAVGNAPTHWGAIRYQITVESPASEEDVMRVLDAAHKQSHLRGDFEHAFTVGREIRIVKTDKIQTV